jgi:hypothetical protein
MTYSEIYRILFFEKTKLITNKIIMSTKNNFIIVLGSAKQFGTQIIYLFNYLFFGVIYA